MNMCVLFVYICVSAIHIRALCIYTHLYIHKYIFYICIFEYGYV